MQNTLSVPANAYGWTQLDSADLTKDTIRVVYKHNSRQVWLSISPCTNDTHHACLFGNVSNLSKTITQADCLLELIATRVSSKNTKIPLAITPNRQTDVADAYRFASL